MRKSRALRKESRRKKHIPTAMEQKPMPETSQVVEPASPVTQEQPAPSRAPEAVERPIQKTSVQSHGEKYSSLLSAVQQGEDIDLPELLEYCEEQIVFVTGLAGCGKTAAMKRWLAKTRRKAIVCAPTGVAALLCGGTTIHRAFGLPITVMDEDAIEQCALRQRKAVKFADLLVIDEASMVLPNMLDNISKILQRARNNRRLPFGGMRVVLFGDLQQLPAVAHENEWAIINRNNEYDTQFFFSSLTLKAFPPLVLNLTKVFRQSEQEAEFIKILNAVRSGKIGDELLEKLNSRVRPNFGHVPGYVFIASTNREVDAVNKQHLASLPGPEQTYESIVTGDFNPKDAPCDSPLVLRIGAQVMITANEQRPADETRKDDEFDDWKPSYVNGTVGEVVEMHDRGVAIKTPAGERFYLGIRKWDKVKYEVVEDKITTEVTGTLSQLPLRLAAAITSHKVQGSSLDNIIVDSSRIFENGQLYVALSRCRTLGGLVLKNPVTREKVMAASGVAEWYESMRQAGRFLDVLQKTMGDPAACEPQKPRDPFHAILEQLSSGEFLPLSELQEIINMPKDKLSALAMIGLPVFIDELISLRAEVAMLKKKSKRPSMEKLEMA